MKRVRSGKCGLASRKTQYFLHSLSCDMSCVSPSIVSPAYGLIGSGVISDRAIISVNAVNHVVDTQTALSKRGCTHPDAWRPHECMKFSSRREETRQGSGDGREGCFPRARNMLSPSRSHSLARSLSLSPPGQLQVKSAHVDSGH